MSKYSRIHLTDGALLQGLKDHVTSERVGTAEVLADLAEVDVRKLYLPAAYPSMYAYCVGELRLSEDAAWNRIRAARTARRFPAIFGAVADGRLHLSAVVLIGPHLTPENADELLAAAAGRSKAEVESLLAQRFPRPDAPGQTQVVASQLAPGQAGSRLPEMTMTDAQPAPGRVEASRTEPRAPERPAVQCTILRSTNEKLQYARALLGHQPGAKDSATLLDRAVDAWIEQLEKRKFAKTSRPRAGARRCASARHIPAEVKRRVWERDQGQCTFVSEKGQRCSARSRLEFDHADPVARGGTATLDRIRLLCRAHNQYEAERVFGVPFMNHKREEARRRASVTAAPQDVCEAGEHAALGAKPTIQAQEPEPEHKHENDVTPWLRALGFRSDQIRRAAAHCQAIPDASLEERVRHALSYLGGPQRRVAAPVGR